MLALDGSVREERARLQSPRIPEEVAHIGKADPARVKYIGDGDILNQVSPTGLAVVVENSKSN